jgi:hypothetical protein
MERINRRGRGEALKDGEVVAVYVPPSTGVTSSTQNLTSNDPLPNGPLPNPPVPDLLPNPNGGSTSTETSSTTE